MTDAITPGRSDSFTKARARTGFLRRECAMFIGKVTGTVVATQKTETFVGSKLLLVEAYSAQAGKTAGMKPTGRVVVVVDAVGAGENEFVLVTQGSSARLTKSTGDMPVDAVAVGIIDSIHIGEKTVLEKGEE